MSSFTKPIRPAGGALIKASHMDNHARAIEELQRALSGEPKNKRRYRAIKPPFWPTLFGDATAGFTLTMKKGWVSSTHWKYGVDSVKSIEVTSIPGDPDPDIDRLTVASGDKIYATLTESVIGEITAAVIGKASSWPESSAAKLTGGNDQTGLAGTRYVRLCEIVTVSGQVKVKVIHTGNIEHSAPVRSENTDNSISGNEARVLKEWDSATAQWMFRYLEGGTGMTVTEGTDKITLAATATGLPSGTSGQMLYHNGSGWVVINAPSAPSGTEINILTHSGTVPSWSTKNIVTLSYCASGTPTTGDFIKL